MVTQKDRRKNGYSTPLATISKKDLIENDLFINSLYDDWDDYRDGFRDWFRDFKKIKKIDNGYREFNDQLYDKRIRMNRKQKCLLKRRKFRRNTLYNFARMVCHNNIREDLSIGNIAEG
jgi:hypothetical protein